MTGFSKLHGFACPRTVLVGHDAVDEVGDVVDELGVTGSATVVADPITRDVAGERVQQLVGKAGLEADIVEVEAATEAAVDRVQAEAGDVLLGVGGGTVIDVTKLASHRAERPFVSVPTSAAHDGICSPRASIKSEEGSKSEPAHVPVAVVADTSVIVEAPYRMLAAGCADAISNLTAVRDWQLARDVRDAEYYASAAKLSRSSAEMVLEEAEIFEDGAEEAAWVAVEALVMSGVGMSIAGSSRPASGAEHLWSHRLDQLLDEPAMHGEQVGVGAIVSMYLHDGDHAGIRDALAEIGAPTTLDELGVPEDVAIQAWTTAHSLRPERYTILGEDGIDEATAREALTATGVG